MRLRSVLPVPVIVSVISMMISSYSAGQSNITQVDSTIAVSSGADDEAEPGDWWEDWRFGMLIHFDPFSINTLHQPGETNPEINTHSMKDRNQLLSQFNPKLFNADEWVRLAQEAGVQLIVPSVRNNDGFCLFDSPYTDSDIASTPIKRDILQEMIEACRKRGMPVGWYYVLPDESRSVGEKQQGDDNEIVLHEVDELFTKYGPVDIIWFESNGKNERTDKQHRPLYNHIKSVSPKTVIRFLDNHRTDDHNDRVHHIRLYHDSIPQRREAAQPWLTLTTLNDSPGRNQADIHWKSPVEIIHSLITTVSRGGNDVLDVTVAGDGSKPTPMVDELKRVGAWLKVNGDSVYGCKPSPFHYLQWGRATIDRENPSRMYFHIFDWPTHDGMLRLPGVMNRVEKAWFLKRGPKGKLRTLADRGGVMVRVGRKPIDSLCTVLVVDVAGAPDVADVPIFPQAHTGVVILEAGDAYLHGSEMCLEEGGGANDIRFTTNPEEWAQWDFEIRKGGEFNLRINYECSGNTDDSRFLINIYKKNDDTIIATTTQEMDPSEGEEAFPLTDPGVVHINDPGRYIFRASVKGMPHDAVLKLRSIRLEPKS